MRQLFVFSIRCEGNIFYFGFARSISSSHTSGMKFVQFFICSCAVVKSETNALCTYVQIAEGDLQLPTLGKMSTTGDMMQMIYLKRCCGHQLL
jgi:hypothetical protein